LEYTIGWSGKALPTFGGAKNHKSIESDPIDFRIDPKELWSAVDAAHNFSTLSDL